jgi:hypothetical protein
MTNLGPIMLVPTQSRIEQIDLWDAWFGEGDHPGSVARHGFAASSARARGAMP